MEKGMVRTIKNVSHDLMPLVKDMQEKLQYLKEAKTASDLAKLTKTLNQDAILLEHYLEELDKDAERHHIEKVKIF